MVWQLRVRRLKNPVAGANACEVRSLWRLQGDSCSPNTILLAAVDDGTTVKPATVNLGSIIAPYVCTLPDSSLLDSPDGWRHEASKEACFVPKRTWNT